MMTGHSAWMRALGMPPEATGRECTVCYTRGYILAMEDVLGDLVQLDMELAQSCGLPLPSVVTEMMSKKVKDSLLSARMTLNMLEEK
jgi:hypothetical protein